MASLGRGLFLLERIDQIDGGEEPDFLAVMLDGLDTERGGDVRLALAGSADQHNIVGAIDELAAVELADHGFVDLAGSEVEPSQIFVGGEPGSLDLVGDRPDLALSHLCLEQLGQDRYGCVERGRALLDQIADGLGHAVHLQRLEHDHHGGAGGIMTHGAAVHREGHRSARHWRAVPGHDVALAAHRSGTPEEPCRRSAGTRH